MTSRLDWLSGARESLQFGFGRRVPVIAQDEIGECGHACLAMIARYYRSVVDASFFRRGGVSHNGTTFADLASAAEKIGFQARPVRLDLENLSLLRLPCILHWDFNHFVVLTSVSSRRVSLIDPAIGEMSCSMNEASERFTGVAMELLPGPDFRRGETAPEAMSFSQLFKGSVGLWRALGVVLLYALVLEVFALLIPLFSQLTLDRVIPDGDSGLLLIIGTAAILLVCCQAIFGAARAWTVMHVSTNLSLGWMANLFRHLLSLPYDFFSKRHLGDVVSRFGSLSSIQQTLTTRLVEVITDGIMVVLTIAFMLGYSWRLSLLCFLAVSIYLILRAISYQLFRTATLAQIVSSASLQSHFLECVRGIQTIKLFSFGTRQAVRYTNKLAESLNRGIEVQRWTIVFTVLNTLLFGSLRVVVLWIGAMEVIEQRMTAGMLLAFIAYGDQFSGRSSALIDYAIELRMLKLHAERLADIALAQPEPELERHDFASALNSTVEFDNVSFSYSPTDPVVLNGMSMRIEEGESVALIGQSGCGKTTLAKLLLGLLVPTSGTIRVGGFDISRVDRGDLRSVMGAVMQDDQLFAGTIEENIAFFEPIIDRERVREVSAIAGVHDDIERLPMRYASRVGDMGTALSGGQKQRIVLARAIYKRPQILVLDEATSHLDVAMERAVNSAVASLGLTRIMIAHRPETIFSADRVILMNDGSAAELSGHDVRKLLAGPQSEGSESELAL